MRGAGESLAHFPTRDGDRVLAGRGYSTAAGLHRVVSSGGHLTVRVNTGALPLRTTDGAPFDLLTAVGTLKRAGAVRSWPRGGGRGWHRGAGALVCDSERRRKQSGVHAASCAKKEATRKGKQIQPRPPAFARDGIVFATFREPAFTASQVLERCRVRWQVEPLFKRFKSPAQLGHVPKYDDSARAWLYGKLLVALLAEKLIRHARESLKNSYRDSGIYGNPLISRSSKRFK